MNRSVQGRRQLRNGENEHARLPGVITNSGLVAAWRRAWRQNAEKVLADIGLAPVAVITVTKAIGCSP